MRLEEIYCHACNKYVRFKIDETLDGNHVFNCPNCGHEHCRVMKNGQITGDRWTSRNGRTYAAVTAGTSNYSMYSGVATTTAYYLRDAWINSA